MYEKAQAAAEFLIKKNDGLNPEIIIILGSGLSDAVSFFEKQIVLSYSEIPNMTLPSVQTHKGQVILGETNNIPVVCFQGRIHGYEGYSQQQITFPLMIASLLNVKVAIITNLVGGIASHLQKGEFVVVKDSINLAGTNPLRDLDVRFKQKQSAEAANEYKQDLLGGALFVKKPLPLRPPHKNSNRPSAKTLHMIVNCSNCQKIYDTEYSKLFIRLAAENEIPCSEGVLAYLTGPNFETVAELKYLRQIGSDIIGWSLVPESILAHHLGMKVLAISCVSDLAIPESLIPVDIEDLFQTGQKLGQQLGLLLSQLLRELN